MLYTPMPAIQGVKAKTKAVEMMLRTKTTDVRASPRIYSEGISLALRGLSFEHLWPYILITVLTISQGNITASTKPCANEPCANCIDRPCQSLTKIVSTFQFLSYQQTRAWRITHL